MNINEVRKAFGVSSPDALNPIGNDNTIYWVVGAVVITLLFMKLSTPPVRTVAQKQG